MHRSELYQSVSLPALTPTFTTAFIPLRSATVAFDAILEIGNAFADMFRPYAVGLMLVATIAGVLTGIVVDVAGGAFGVVVAVEQKELSVVERRRLPALSGMALGAACGDIAVDRSLGCRVA